MKTNRHLISKYLLGELDSVQSADFEKVLVSDSAIRQEVNLYQEVDKAIADTDVLELRSQLNALHEPMLQELSGYASRSGKKYGRYAAAAATIAVIIGIGVLGFLKNQDSLVSKFYHPYTMTMVTRSADLDVDMVLREALLRYDNKKYRDAVILFEKVIESDPEMISANLYAGISYFEIKEYSNAEISLDKVIRHNDNLYIEQAEWYMGFCYLMTDRKDKAIMQFTKIAESNSYYSQKAKKILKKLK